MSNEHDSQIEFPTIFYDNRLQLAQEMWKQDNDIISKTKTANMYDVKKLMLRDHINSAIPKIEAS